MIPITNQLSFDGYQPGPVVQQSKVENASTTSQQFSIKAQSNFNATAIGGNLAFYSGEGSGSDASTAGEIILIIGNTNMMHTAGTNQLLFYSSISNPLFGVGQVSGDTVNGTSLVINSGSASSTASTFTSGGTLHLRGGAKTAASTGSDGYVLIETGSASNLVAQFGNNLSDFLTLGGISAAATNGIIRIPNLSVIKASNFLVNANISLIGTDTNNNVVIGDGLNLNSIFLNTTSAAGINIANAGSTAMTIIPNNSGASQITIASTVTGFTFQYNNSSTNSGTGGTFTIRGQNMSGTTSIGGNTVITSGTGTSVAGNLLLECGGVAVITVAPALITMAQAVKNTTLSTGIGHYDASGNLTSSAIVTGDITFPLALGSSTATTQAATDNSTKVATTAYVDRIILKPTIAWFHDDFINQAGASSITAASTVYGDTPWGIAQIVGGTQTYSPVAGTNANMGQASMLTSATSGQGCSMVKISGPGPLSGIAGWEVLIAVKISTTSTICMRVGLFGRNDQAQDPPTDGIYVEYDTANTGNTSTDFTWVTRSASTPNYSTTNAIAADTSFHEFRIRSVVAGTILFSVDGGAEASVSTDVPTVALMPCLQILTRTAAGVTLTIDYYNAMFTTTRT